MLCHVSAVHSFCGQLKMDVPHFFVHSSTDGHAGCFHLQAVMNNAAVNAPVTIFAQPYVFISVGFFWVTW